MIAFNDLPSSPQCDIKRFDANSVTLGGNWSTWTKPVGLSMCSIFLLGSGGGGGTGVVGANSTAGGGAGGGSGGQTVIEMPLFLLPDVLYVSVAYGAAAAGIASVVSIAPSTTSGHIVGIANGGGVGGNASAGTGGTAGGAGSIATSATMPLGWAWAKLALAGQAGGAGGAAVAGTGPSLPTTGLRVTSGGGGGGLPAAAAAGTNGGAISGLTPPTVLTGLTGGNGSATATNPADNGKTGYVIDQAGFFSYGGTGGASTHGTATGAGLVQSRGGDGGIGSGGGGMGGALTGSTAAAQSKGGNGLVIIVCW